MVSPIAKDAPPLAALDDDSYPLSGEEARVVLPSSESYGFEVSTGPFPGQGFSGAWPSTSLWPSVPSAFLRPRANQVLSEGLTAMDQLHYATAPGRPELGTWTEGSNSGVWDTAMALITELTLGTANLEHSYQMLRYLVSQQHADGGWPDSPGDAKSSISATVICYAAVQAFIKRFSVQAIATGRKDVVGLVGVGYNAQSFVVGRGFDGMDAACLKANFVCLLYYAQVFPETTTVIETIWQSLKAYGIDWNHLPAPESLAAWCSENGIYQVFPEVIACLVVLLAPADVKASPVYGQYLVRLLDYQDSNGMWCDVSSISNLCLIALHRAGYSGNSVVIERGLDAVRALQRQGTDGIQAYTYDSSTWNNCLYIDTRLRLDSHALSDPHVLAGIRYLLACQEADGGFQYVLGADGDGECDTTGFILALLCRVNDLLKKDPSLLPSDANDLWPQIRAAMVVARNNLVTMQNDNGGFSTFARTDRDKAPGAMAFTPGSDLVSRANSITLTDESTADVTAHALMGLGAMGLTVSNSSTVARAVAWLRKDFVPGAGWWGRWGCGYLYGTCEVLRALKAVGVDMGHDPLANAAVTLLISHQNADGGWGETGRKSDDPNSNAALVAMTGRSNVSFTALVTMTLFDLGFSSEHPAVVKGVQYLLNNYQPPSIEMKDRDWLSQNLTLEQQEAVLWHDVTPNADFYPTVWYQKELTFGDLVPMAALARYMQETESSVLLSPQTP